jgi:medium-chain acyl-[acyl-carrier-protein] hydrolase
MQVSNWFVRGRVRGTPRMRLICFPSAGAGASVFGRWGEHLPADVDLWSAQLPGRESRRTEPLLSDIHEVADRCVPSVEPLLDVPFAFFGHSMGALVAYELTRRLASRGKTPIALFLSGRAAPHIARTVTRPLDSLTDLEFMDEMDRQYGGVPDLMRTDMEFRELYLPPLRADVLSVATYNVIARDQLSMPMHIVGGESDRSAPREQLDEWQPYAGSDFKVHMFPGDHFHLYSQREPVVAMVVRELEHAYDRQMGAPVR